MVVKYGTPESVWEALINDYKIEAVFTNRDYEPYALNRDETIENTLTSANIPFHTFKDHILFEKDEVLKDDGLPYTVFTPYSKKWRKKLESRIEANETYFHFNSYPTETYFSNFYQIDNQEK